MNSVSKPQANKNKRRRKPVEKTMELPSDKIILDTLYAHYGTPKNIIKEKVTLYQQYTTPAGMSMGNWTMGEYQMGRVTIFTGAKQHPDDLFERTKIDHSWFVGVSQTHIKVFSDRNVDTILEIGV
tara:strand:+ start:826 stop:1203 length:378 start_codon:yes stop_codon:yes gene_type:complete